MRTGHKTLRGEGLWEVPHPHTPQTMIDQLILKLDLITWGWHFLISCNHSSPLHDSIIVSVSLPILATEIKMGEALKENTGKGSLLLSYCNLKNTVFKLVLEHLEDLGKWLGCENRMVVPASMNYFALQK